MKNIKDLDDIRTHIRITEETRFEEKLRCSLAMNRDDVSGWTKRNEKRQAHGCGLQRIGGEVGSEHTCQELQTRTEDKWLDILASSWSTG